MRIGKKLTMHLLLVLIILSCCKGAYAFINNGNKPPLSNLNGIFIHPQTSISTSLSSLGDFTISLEKPLGIVLEERDIGSGGVQVKELVEGGAAAAADIVRGDVLLAVGDVDTSSLDFDTVMETITSCDSPLSITIGDGLGILDMPKNVVKQLKSTEDAFLIDAIVRQSVREMRRRTNILGDLLNVEVVIGAGVQEDGKTGQTRFFAIFSTDGGVSSYSCNVSSKGRRLDDDSIEILSLSAAKDEGLGQTYQFI